MQCGSGIGPASSCRTLRIQRAQNQMSSPAREATLCLLRQKQTIRQIPHIWHFNYNQTQPSEIHRERVCVRARETYHLCPSASSPDKEMIWCCAYYSMDIYRFIYGYNHYFHYKFNSNSIYRFIYTTKYRK